MKAAVRAVVVLALAVSGCERRSPSTPTAVPSPVAAATAGTRLQTATLTIGYEQVGGDAAGRHIESEIRDDYVIAQQPFEGVGAWFYRTAYDSIGTSVEFALSIHRQEWRAALDQKRAALGLPAVSWPTERPPQ